MAFHVAVEKPPACPADTAARRIPRGRQLRRSPSPWIATTRVESESFRQCPQVSSSPHRNERAAGEVQSKLTAAVRRRCDSLACTPDSRICTSGNTEAAGPAMESLGPRPGSRVASAYCRHTTVLRLKRPQTAGAPPAGPIRNAPAGSTCACRPAAHRRLCVGIANNRQLQQHVRCQLRCGNQRVRGLAGRHAYSLGRGVGGRRMAGGGWREGELTGLEVTGRVPVLQVGTMCWNIPVFEPGGSARCYWNSYGSSVNHPAQRTTRNNVSVAAAVSGPRHKNVTVSGCKLNHLQDALGRLRLAGVVPVNRHVRGADRWCAARLLQTVRRRCAHHQGDVVSKREGVGARGYTREES